MPSPTAMPSSSPVTSSPLPSASSSDSIPSSSPEPTPRPTGYPVELVAGSGQKGFQDGSALQASFNSPTKPCYNPRTETLFIPDTHMLRKLTADGQVVTVAGGQEAGYKEGQGTEARFNTITACAVDTEGNILLADMNNYRIRKFAPDGLVSTFVGSGQKALRDGPVKDATLTGLITDLVVAPSGIVYFGEDFRLRTIAQGQVITLNKAQGQHVFWQDMKDAPIATSYVFGFGLYLTVDAREYVYVADGTTQALRSVDHTGWVKTLSVPRNETLKLFGDYASAEERELHLSYGPFGGVTFDAARNKVYVSEVNGYKIFRVEPDGKMTAIAGDYFAQGESLFNYARQGLSMGKNDQLYIVDQGSNQIKRILLPPP